MTKRWAWVTTVGGCTILLLGLGLACRMLLDWYSYQGLPEYLNGDSRDKKQWDKKHEKRGK